MSINERKLVSLSDVTRMPLSILLDRDVSNSAIGWTEATWNSVTGCEEVSPGCAHCYAETFAKRWRGIPGHPYEQGFALKLWPQRLEQPLKWSRPRMIFVNSMSDLFHEQIPEPFIRRVFDVMRESTFKQWGGRTAKAGGRLLDGQTYDAMPASSDRRELILAAG
jgi:protein gp37